MTLPLDNLLPKEDPRLDWNPRLDERSLRFASATLIDKQPEVERLWKSGPVLDQGSEGACVGFGWTGEGLSSPYPHHSANVDNANAYALSVYRRAKQIDEWDGENYDGTSVLAGAKVMIEKGAIGSYWWAFSMEDIRSAVIALGPVVIGVPWYNSMYSTRDDGWVDVDVDSGLAGGHCLFLSGYRPRMRFYVPGGGYEYHRVFRWRNSWDEQYGYMTQTGYRNGNGWITYDQLAKLFELYGTEACVPMARKTFRIPV